MSERFIWEKNLICKFGIVYIFLEMTITIIFMVLMTGKGLDISSGLCELTEKKLQRIKTSS